MKIATCANNHIYDSDIYSACPYCDTIPVNPEGDGKDKDENNGEVWSFDFVNDQKTMIVQPGKVVGWLACIGGPETGKSYNLYDRQNRVGRGREYEVVIQKDPTISEKHALIAYDSRHNRFTIVPKTETNLMSLNGKRVERAERMSTFDRIEMGKSLFLFVALCGEQFTWESAESEQAREQKADLQ